MKSFLKITFASMLGVILASFFGFLILLGIIAAASSEKPVIVDPHTILVSKFDFTVVDRDPENPYGSFDLMGITGVDRMGLNHILANFEKAAKDPNIDGIFLDLTTIPAGIASIQEIRNGLLKFKESGKFILAHADYYTQSSYYLASVADSIFLTPTGEVAWLGLAAEPLFFKKALDKLGVEAQIIRAGEYKAAAEPLMYEKLSKENREQISAYIGSVWNNMVNSIATARNLDPVELNRLADNMSVSNAEAALSYNFVDGLKYFDEVLSDLKKLTSTDESKNVKSVTLKKYTRASKPQEEKKTVTRNRIAVIYTAGTIVTGEGTNDNMGADKVAKTIREARRDSSIKAIVLRVNSGGGSALASEVIWREVKLASDTKPLIASLGDVAASGGYYIVAPARKIIASENTITGSIGVFGILPNVSKFMDNKLGITTDLVVTNDHSDLGSFFRPLTPDERIVIQKEVDRIYTTFITRVSEGRKLSLEQVDKIARGHIYTALDAKEIGLVDEFGGLKQAIELAAAEAQITDYKTIEYPRLEDPLQVFLRQISGDVRIKIIQRELGLDYRYLRQLETAKSLRGIQAIAPFDLYLY